MAYVRRDRRAVGRTEEARDRWALTGDPGDEREYPMYPANLTSPYLDRFSAAAAQRYQALGIERDDPTGPRRSPP